MLTVHGAKAGQAQQKAPTIAADTVASISKIKILYILSEGEIKGLAKGAASIMLDGTPLVDPQGVANFEGVEWEMRHGTPDQTHIPGLTAVSSEIGVNTAVRSGTPWVRAVTDIELDSVNVNVSWARLSATTEKFDVIATTVAYAIDVQTDGGGYATVLDTSIKAKTSGRYQRTHNIKLPRASTGWQIRVRKITADGDNEKLFNAMQVDTIAEIVDVKLRYPNSALLYLSYNAQTFSNIPKLSVAALGRYVQIPTNYNEVTRKSIGLWDGTFKQGYTNNPAWVLYDLITNDRYGLGDKLKPFMINKWALENIARICDQEVSDGKGGTEPRHTCNLYLQQAEDAYRVIQHISGIFRGLSFWDGSQIIIEADSPRDTDYVLTRANVIDGMFIKTGTPGADRHTIAKVAFSDPNNAYATDYVMVRNEAAIAQYGINVIEMAAVGCTSEGQAYRMGLAALLTEQNRTQTVTFSMGLEGALPTVGSRVDISDPMFTGKNTGGRISSVSADRKVITLDRDGVPAAPGDRLIVNLENGKAQARVISAVKGRAITVVAAFDAVASENVWTVDSATMPVMPFIVLSVTGNEDMTQYSYVALQYDPGLHSQIDNGTLIDNRPPIPTDSFYNIAAPATMAITSRERVDQGQRITTLVLTWAQVPGAVSYNVQWRKDGGDWITLAPTGNISAEIDGVYAGNYTARVIAVGAMGQVSKYTDAASKTITGREGTPAGLISFTAAGLLFGTRLNWTYGPTSGDAAYVEIEIGTGAGANVTVLGSFAYPTTVHEITGMAGGITRAYRGRIVDRLGNKSPWSEWVTATTEDSAAAILDLVEGQISSSALDQDLRTKIDLSGTNAADISGVKADIAAANATLDKAKADILATEGSLATAKGELATAKTDITKAKTDITEAKRVADLAKTDSEANKTTIANLTTTVGNNKTSVDSSITTLTNKDLALSNLYTALKSEYDNNKASVSQDLTALTNKDISLSSLLTALDTDYQGNKTAIRNELTAVSTKTDSTANSLNSLTTEVGNNKTAITTEATTRSTEDTALSNRITTVSGKTDNALSRITTAETTIANNTGAITQQKTDITAEYKQAIDDIEIGGRNLLENSGFSDKENIQNYWPSNGGGLSIVTDDIQGEVISTVLPSGFVYYDWIKLATDTEYTYSGLVKSDIATAFNSTVPLHYWAGIEQTNSGDIQVTKVSSNSGALIANEWQKISITFKLINGGKWFRPFIFGSSGNLLVKYLKLEKGNIATDWTAAPEDVEASITAAITTESTARSTADTAIGNRITTVEGKTDNALSRVSTVETIAADNKSSIAQTRTDITAEYKSAIDKSVTGARNLLPTKINFYSSDTYTGFKLPYSEHGYYVTVRDKNPNLSTYVTYVFISKNIDPTKSGADYRTILQGSNTLVNTSFWVESGDWYFTLYTEGEAMFNTFFDRYEVMIAKGRNAVDYVKAPEDVEADYIAKVTAEATARSDADGALGIRITNTEAVANNAQARVGTVETAVATNTGAIAQTSTKIQAAINNIEVGGRNLIANSKDITFNNADGNGNAGRTETVANNEYKYITAATNGYVYGFATVIDQLYPNEYTFSIEVYTNFATSMFFRLDGSKDGQILIPNTGNQWQRVDFTFNTYNRLPANHDFLLGFQSLPAGNTIHWRGIQLVKGNKATSWTPAPEDVKKEVSAIQVEAKATADKVTGLYAQYTVKLDVGGRVSGFGLASSATQSDFAINADKFYIAPPTGTAKGASPFMVLTTATTINGTSVPAGTYMRSAFIHNAAVDTLKIAGRAVTFPLAYSYLGDRGIVGAFFNLDIYGDNTIRSVNAAPLAIFNFVAEGDDFAAILNINFDNITDGSGYKVGILGTMLQIVYSLDGSNFKILMSRSIITAPDGKKGMSVGAIVNLPPGNIQLRVIVAPLFGGDSTDRINITVNNTSIGLIGAKR